MRLVAAGMLFLLVGCGRWVEKPVPGEVRLSGRIEGDEIDLAFKRPGRIAAVTVREGDRVEAGAVLARLTGEQEAAWLNEARARHQAALARLEQARLQVATLEQRVATARLQQAQAGADAPARVEQAQAQRLALEAELERVKAEEAQVRADAARYRALAEKGAAPRQLAEQYESRVTAARAAVAAVQRQIAAAEGALNVARAMLANPEIRAAEASTYERQVGEARAAVKLVESEVAAARAALERAETDVAELELRAPVSGTVITRAAEPGRVVAAGATVLVLVDLDRLYLRGFVPEGDIGRVKLAQRAEVFLDSAPTQPLEAEVMRVDPQAMFTPENTYFQKDRIRQVVGVKLRLKEGAGAAKPGMPAEARILTGG